MSVVLFWVGRWWSLPWAVLLALASVFCLYFFRDLDRPTVLDRQLIYSPGDGKVMAVEPIVSGPQAGHTLIRIFLSVFDGHVQRSPVAGTVQKVVYKKGAFLDARNPEAHVRNEQNEVTFVTENGPIVVTQIAGLIARRIVCWAKEGIKIEQAQRYGLIRFGSQVDVLLPPNTKILVGADQRVVGGMTVLAQWVL